MNDQLKIPIIILAAGSSTRMGTAKQLLPYQGITLLGHTIKIAIASVCHPVVVVLGANADKIRPEIDEDAILVVENPSWFLGMGSSIRQGILSLLQSSQTIEAAIITVCDQPFLSTELINDLVVTYHNSKKSIIACQYADTYGVPVLFQSKFFSELASLNEKEGAKKLIKKYENDVLTISFPQGVIDIDTPQDYQQLQQH
ncbi:MAG: nucleotidyltransferase family protein [Crocosphaera sp.]|nr:nucleotidyltransferase family protein [Crocosphaera sp.]